MDLIWFIVYDTLMVKVREHDGEHFSNNGRQAQQARPHRVLTKSHVLALEETGEGLSVRPATLYVNYIDEPDTTPRAAVSKIIPDWSSLRKCACSPKYALVACWVHEGVDGMQFSRDPRSLWVSAVERARRDYRIDFFVGFELEFVILKPCDGQLKILQNVPGWSSMAGLRNEFLPVLEQLVLVLQSAGIDVQQFHTEGPQGMFEIVTGPLRPLESVDALVYAVETIKTICWERTLKATFFPNAGRGHTGQHIHLSITNVAKENAFLAGILRQLPSICAFTMPNIDSYSRVKDLAGASGS